MLVRVCGDWIDFRLKLALLYSATFFSKKLVLFSVEIRSIQSNGLGVSQCLGQFSCINRRSATNSMYRLISVAFIPIKLQGKLSLINSFSIATTSVIMAAMLAWVVGYRSRLCNKQPKSVWRPSSREINSLEKVTPGSKPRFFNQKMAQKGH